MSTDLKLFEITQQFCALNNLTVSDDIPSEVIADTIEGLEGDFEQKAVAVAKFILSLESSAEAIEIAAKAMKARGDRIQRRADNIRAYLLFNLQSVDRKRIDTAEIVIKRVNNPPAVQVTDEDMIPEKFWFQPEPPPPRLDKKAIATALKSGEAVPGAFVEAGERLAIEI